MPTKNAKANHYAADSHADLESDSANAPNVPHGVAPFDSRVRLTFTHYRKRLCDIDGLSVKAAIDGLVAAEILRTDSPQQVSEVIHRQVKGEPERTEIVIEEVE